MTASIYYKMALPVKGIIQTLMKAHVGHGHLIFLILLEVKIQINYESG